MKFRNPKTGEVFDSIDPKLIPLYGSYEIEPIVAASLIGFEVITDDEEANMEKKDKPRLAEVLGVEEDEKWRYPECAGLYRVHNGVREYWDENNGWLYCDCEEDLVKIIAHPELIIRTPRLTEPEMAICKALGAKWVSRDSNDNRVCLWNSEPICRSAFEGFYSPELGGLGWLVGRLFPSVHPGDCICAEEADSE